MDDPSGSGSDFEAQMKSLKRKKKSVAMPGPQLPKRPRQNAAVRASSSHSRSSIPSQQQQHSRGTSRQASQGISAGDLYEAVCSGKSAMVTVVDEWLDSYKESRKEGLLVLVNFIVQCCGCKGVVNREMLDNKQNAEIISMLTQEFNEHSAIYPLCTPGPQLKRFKAGLCEFARVLVRSCQNSLIYDEFLFPSLLALLTGLSDSQVRAFRHTSTLLVLKLMTGLVEVAVAVSVQLQNTQHLHDTTCSSTRQVRGQNVESRVCFLTCMFQRLENREELSSLMNSVFRGVFVHRYRDRVPEIRVACIEGLGTWLKTAPEDFLNDGCLKYLGWTLHDKQSPVRLVCVRALQGLYQEKEFIGRLELFTNRFRERMLSMALDKDPDVAVEVLHLLFLIHRNTEEGLPEEDIGNIYTLVYASHRGLASAAALFLYKKMQSLIVANQVNFLQVLVSFHIETQFHDHWAYLVDGLWSVAGSELKDWEAMTASLLQETDAENGFSDEEEGTLIELMICAVRQAAEATPPAGRSQGKKSLSTKEKKIQAQDRRRITTHFIPLLPQLVAKFSADVEKVGLLLMLPLYFDLEMYSSSGRLEKYLDLLLSQICGIVKKHTKAAVLEACARLASALCSDRYTFSSRAHLAFGQLLDGLTDCFNAYLNDLLQATADEDEVYSAATALKRVAAFSSAKDLTGWKLLDPCMQLLKHSMESIGVDKELVVAALKCAALHLMWAKLHVVNSKPAQAELERLKREVRSFCKVCQTCLSQDQAEVRDQAFELLCDLLVIYSETSVRSEPALQMLAHKPSDSLRFMLATFVVDYVFTGPNDVELTDEDDANMKITVLRKKRNQLAGYCKLVIYGVLDLSAVTNVLKHYNKYYGDFGDIIKETLSKTKLISPEQSAKTVCLTLQQMFSEMLLEEYSSEDLAEIRDLAKRLAMSFGIVLQPVSKLLVTLHMDGIRFALRCADEEEEEEEEQRPNLAFFEILSEFSSKVLQQDRNQLAAFLVAECPAAALPCPSVRIYRGSLAARSSSRQREAGEAGGRRSKAASSRSTPAAKRSRATAQDTVSSGSRASWLDSSIHSNLPTPAFTSTVQRQPGEQVTPDPQEGTVRGSGSAELGSDDEFSGFRMRKVKPRKRPLSSSSHSIHTADEQELDSHITRLSLIEEANAKEGEGEAEIEEFHSDSDQDAEYSLPSTRHTSPNFLDKLFQ
ncbi:cohesin subunit SA-1 [Genypterus blacodes]|uniref:cohesin subunit SA-1 n=1 Tax=Genypterus blacodes TaxID=154954 RepID=UPI003F76946D